MLTSEIAQDLCTLVALGFVKTDGAKNRFEYAPTATDAEKTAHANVQALFQGAGVPMAIGPSREEPWIVASTDRVPTREAASPLTDENWRYLQAAAACASQVKPPPTGAYIGGMSTISTLFIVGASTFDLYAPAFREPLDATVKPALLTAITESNNARGCLITTKAASPTGVKVELSDLNDEIKFKESDFKPGSLFKSYHGMVRAMVKYQSSYDKNAFIFEIALGPNTTKASSCLPCSIFMTASGKPATSTHLGRGDYWNIPPDCAQNVRSAWEQKVAAYYQAGKALMGARLPPTTMDYLREHESHIPAVFLEALTFDGSFVSKITATFGRAKPKA